MTDDLFSVKDQVVLISGASRGIGRAIAGQRLADEVVDQFGRIDTLVNCAGVNKRMKVEQYDEETYDFITDINIRGAFFLSLAARRPMIEAGSGSQANMHSTKT